MVVVDDGSETFGLLCFLYCCCALVLSCQSVRRVMLCGMPPMLAVVKQYMLSCHPSIAARTKRVVMKLFRRRRSVLWACERNHGLQVKRL